MHLIFKNSIFVLLVFVINAFANIDSGLNHDPFQISSNVAGENMQSALVTLHYANAEEIGKTLVSNIKKFLSENGSFSVDKRTNAIWIQDFSENIFQIKHYLKSIDVPVNQIIIEARIVSADQNFSRELGVEFGTKHDTGKDSQGLNIDIPDSGTFNPGHFGVAIAKLNNGTILDLELAAMESEGRGEVISRPKLITLDRESAYIESGEDIPYQEKTSQGNTSIAFKKATLGLKVIPEIINTNSVLLRIIVNQDKISSLLYNGQPAISTREIKTQVVVSNKQTIVLGGIYEQSKDHAIVRMPLLGSIPVLGPLFSYKKNTTERKELLIFITPEIVILNQKKD